MMKKLALIATSTVMLSACSGSSDYAPEAGVAPMDMYKAACMNCHSPVDVDGKTVFWQIAPENANSAYVKAKLTEGSMMMPAFPNVKGEQLDALVKFVLENHQTK